MKLKTGVMAAALMAVACGVQAQVVVKHLQPNEKSPIANGVWAGDTTLLERAVGFAGDASRLKRRVFLRFMGIRRRRL